MKKFFREYQGFLSFTAIILVFGLAAGASVACAQELPEGLTGEKIEIPVICGDTMVMYRELLETHGEVPVVIGFTDRNTAVVWFTNEDRSTMSVVIDTPHRSCMIYTSTCIEGDCYMTPKENYEREKKKMIENNTSPKVSM